MAYIFYFLIFTILCVFTSPTVAQTDCNRNSLRGLSLSLDAILSWEPVPNGDCTISHYLVYIKSGNDDEKLYTAEGPSIDVKFLPACENTRFVVIAVSPDNIQGSVVFLFADMPVPAHVNLTIASIVLSHTYEGIMLTWRLEDEYRRCAKRYRVLMYDEATDTPVDVYVTSPSIRVDNLIPCNSYEFGVTALYNLEEEGPVSVIRYAADATVMSTPTLRSISLGTTTIDLVWQMQSVLQNRCPVSVLTIDAYPYFRISYPVRDQNSRLYFPTSLSGLQPDTLYMLNVTVTNSAGATAPVLIAVQTLAIN